MTHVLEVKSVTKTFGGLSAITDVNLLIKKGSISAVIGPNGAGKTTLFNIITGVYEPDCGTIELAGKNLLGLKSHDISKAGIARTFQNIRLFGNITVLENVMVGMHNHLKGGLAGTILGLPYIGKEERNAEREAYRLLQYVGIEEYFNEQACNLPYGAQRRLEIARALATKPSLLLLDEPAAGMNPKETTDLTNLIKRIRDELDISIVLIEHDMKLVMEISEYIAVLDHGEKIAEGTAADIRSNQKVIEAYLGKSAVEQ